MGAGHLRVVVPHPGSVHPLAARALEDLAPEAEYHDVSTDDLAYSRILARLWADAEGFLVVEHDKVLTTVALAEADRCPCPWGVGQYVMRPGLMRGAMGCTRFSTDLLRKHPDVMERVLSEGTWGGGRPRGHWQGLDYAICEILAAEGVSWHPHSVVAHHHWYDPQCLCGSLTPTICPTREHHWGDFGCETWHEVAPEMAEQYGLEDARAAAIREGEEGQRRAHELIRRQALARQRELERLDPVTATRQREIDRAAAESLRRHNIAVRNPER